VVTGAGRGIGRAIALALAAAGACVAVLARSGPQVAETVEMIEQAGGRAHAFAMDVTDATAVRTTMKQIEHTLGPVSLSINDAAQLGPVAPFSETDAGEWWRTMDVNLRGPVMCTRAVLPGMISRHIGRIINVVSSAVPFPYLSSYITSKTALIRFTETVATEIKQDGINMFALIPGTVRTVMSEYSLNSAEGQKWLPWFRRIFEEGLDVPPERPALLVLELASGRADGLLGRLLSVSGELDTLLRNAKEIEENNLLSLRVRTLDAGEANAALSSIRAEGERAPRHVVHIERTFQAPAAKVFEAWTDPEAVKKWFVHAAPVHWIHDPIMNLKPGGHYSWSVVSDDNDREVFAFHGTYRRVDWAKRLVFSWEWQTLPIEGVVGPGNTLVTVEFLQRGDTTKVVLAQTGLPSAAARDAHDKGWQRCFDGIGKLLVDRL
jgi:NAD(P)-dependent dehydrogenase (short-subunit alcohol dehydrogenase family)/uncharacterized protein YndB with AHSA1/START domain